MKTKTAIVTALVLFATNAFGAGVTLSQQEVQDLPYTHIATEISLPGESENAFLTRIAPELVAYSAKTHFEACGKVATDGHGRYGVVIGSNGSHLACVEYNDKVPEGMTTDGTTIHSHARCRFSMNHVDKVLNPSLAAISDSRPVPLVMDGEDLYHFSQQDFLSGPGYLATPNGVIYQNGSSNSVVAVK